MIYRALLQRGGDIALVYARRHTYHRDRSAALRALERGAKGIPARGFLWPLTAGDLSSAEVIYRLHSHDLPVWVETVAL